MIEVIIIPYLVFIHCLINFYGIICSDLNSIEHPHQLILHQAAHSRDR